MVNGAMWRRFVQVDVFASRPGVGNPLAVVFAADQLDSAQMQAIASWTNLAETTFVLEPSRPDADYRVRIFTTQKEIAFAGHPSIGTAHAVLGAGLIKARDGVLRQECQAGCLPIRVEQIKDRSTLSVRVPNSRMLRFANSDDRSLHLALTGASLAAQAPALVEGGRRWWLAELASESAVRSFSPNRAAIAQLAQDSQSLGLCIFARCADANDGLVVRAFPLGVGIEEDPASGAANAAIAAWLDETHALGELGTCYRVSQGREIGRDASLLLRVDDEHQVWVGGESQTLIQGKLRW